MISAIIENEATQMLSEEVQSYIKKYTEEKDSLVAKYIAETGLNPSQIVLVEHATKDGRIFYPELKSKFDLDVQSQLESSLQMIAILELALEKIAEDFGTDCADVNVLIAHDALASLNTWRKNGG